MPSNAPRSRLVDDMAGIGKVNAKRPSKNNGNESDQDEAESVDESISSNEEDRAEDEESNEDDGDKNSFIDNNSDVGNDELPFRREFSDEDENESEDDNSDDNDEEDDPQQKATATRSTPNLGANARNNQSVSSTVPTNAVQTRTAQTHAAAQRTAPATLQDLATFRTMLECHPRQFEDAIEYPDPLEEFFVVRGSLLSNHSPVDLLNLLIIVRQYWTLSSNNNYIDMNGWTIRRMHVEYDKVHQPFPTAQQIVEARDNALYRVSHFYTVCFSKGLLVSTTEFHDIYSVFDNVMCTIANSANGLLIMSIGVDSAHPSRDARATMNLASVLAYGAAPTSTDAKGACAVILFIIESLRLLGYRRGTDGYVYEPIKVKTGNVEYRTPAWKQVCKIKELAARLIDSRVNEVIWNEWAGNLRVQHTVDRYLEIAREHEFPELQFDNFFYAFRNGAYRVDEQRFFPYEDRVDFDTAACMFYDTVFPIEYLEGRWEDIPTPLYDKITKHQQWPEEVRMWKFPLLGRMIFPTNLKDGWQIMVYNVGQPGSGKSAELQIILKWFPAGSLGIIMNNVEDKFGLSPLANCRAILGMDIDRNFRLDQGSFLQAVAGEHTACPVKHGNPIVVKWASHFLFSGNAMLGYLDNGGNIGRRVVQFGYQHAVDGNDADTSLVQKIEETGEHIALLVKCSRAYLEKTERLGNQSIWPHLPQYFRDRRSELQENNNPMEGFLLSDRCVLFPGSRDHYVLYDDFQREFKAFVHTLDQRIDRRMQDEHVLRTIFRKHGLTTARIKLHVGGRTVEKKVIYGLEVFLTNRPDEVGTANVQLVEPNNVPSSTEDTTMEVLAELEQEQNCTISRTLLTSIPSKTRKRPRLKGTKGAGITSDQEDDRDHSESDAEQDAMSPISKERMQGKRSRK